MASVILKKNNLLVKYYSELVLTSNSLCNWLPVVGLAITLYKSRNKLNPNLQHLRRIGQSGFAQNGKAYTWWKHSQDGSVKDTLVSYEGDYIYQIIRYSNVDWIKNFLAQKMSTPVTAKPCHTIQGKSINRLFDFFKELKNTTALKDILIPIDFSISGKSNIPFCN